MKGQRHPWKENIALVNNKPNNKTNMLTHRPKFCSPRDDTENTLFVPVVAFHVD